MLFGLWTTGLALPWTRHSVGPGILLLGYIAKPLERHFNCWFWNWSIFVCFWKLLISFVLIISLLCKWKCYVCTTWLICHWKQSGNNSMQHCIKKESIRVTTMRCTCLPARRGPDIDAHFIHLLLVTWLLHLCLSLSPIYNVYRMCTITDYCDIFAVYWRGLKVVSVNLTIFPERCHSSQYSILTAFCISYASLRVNGSAMHMSLTRSQS